MEGKEGPQKDNKEESPVVKVPDHILQKAILDLEGKHKGIPAQEVIEGDTTYTEEDLAAGAAFFGGGKVFREGKAIDPSELKPIPEPQVQQAKIVKKRSQPKDNPQQNPKPDIA